MDVGERVEKQTAMSFFYGSGKGSCLEICFFFLLPYYAAHSFWLDNYTWHRLLQQLNM